MPSIPSPWPIPSKLAALGSLVLLVLSVVTLGAPTPSPAGQPTLESLATPGALVLAGCGSNGPITRLLVSAFAEARPGVQIEVKVIGSTNGIWLAAGGAVPIGLTSRPLRENEKGLGLTVVPYARTPLVIAAHPSVADIGITADQLVDVYKGTRARWSDGQDLVLLTRERGEGSIQVLSQGIVGFGAAYTSAESARRGTIVYSEQEMHRLLTARPFALGLSDLGTLMAERLPVKAMKVNGVAPTLEDVASGRYPLVKTLAFVFREDTLARPAKAFVDFARSPEGARILRANGYLPAQ